MSMTDQAPELLPGEIDESGWVIELGESEPTRPAYWIGPSENPAHWPFGMWSDDNLKAVRFARREDAGAVVKLTVDASHNDPRATFRIAEHSWYCPPLTRPTPSERPVAQVREALAKVEEIATLVSGYNVQNSDWAFRKGVLYECIGELRRALTSERPSEAQVEDEIVRLGSAIMDRRAERPSEAAVAYMATTEDGNIRIWSKKPEVVKVFAEEKGLRFVPLYPGPYESAVACRTDLEIHSSDGGVEKHGDFSQTRSESPGAQDRIEEVAPLPSEALPHGDAVREKALRGEIWCLREVVRGVRAMNNLGAFTDFEGEPWLKRVNNIDLDHDPCAALSPTLASERVSEREDERSEGES